MGRVNVGPAAWELLPCLAWLLFIGLGSAGANAIPTADDLLTALQNATAPAQCSAVQEEIEFSRTGLKTVGPSNNHVRMIGHRYWDHQRIAYKLESWSLEDHLAASSPSNLIRMIVRRDDVFTYTHFSGKRPRFVSMTSDKAGVESKRNSREGEEDFGSFLDGYLADVNGTITLVDLARRGDTRVLPEQQSIGNAPCWVVESQGEFGTLHIWVAPGEDFNAVKFTLEEGESPQFKDESGVPFKSRGKRFDQAATTVVNGRKLIAAGRLVNTFTRRDGTALIETVQIKRGNIALTPNFELLHAFELDDVPNGTRVQISSGVASPIQYVWQDGRAVKAHDPAVERGVQRVVEDSSGVEAVGIPQRTSDGINFVGTTCIVIVAASIIVIILHRRRERRSGRR